MLEEFTEQPPGLDTNTLGEQPFLSFSYFNLHMLTLKYTYCLIASFKALHGIAEAEKVASTRIIFILRSTERAF
uniref:Uncharacterized protein n=1 Tax=Anguilla anguilla TaxID=7936 RepID=A0A0E9PL47_ANGAN